jgi:DNA-binding transcriptional LysR family regulator
MSTATVTHLQAFLVVARLSSFSAAARELGVSRAAVSHSVRELEGQLRVVLLTRTTRSVSLTDAGRRLADTAGPALGQVFSAMREIGARPGEAVGRLRLSVPRSAIPFVIDPVLPAFRARHPRVDVEVVVEERFVNIVAEGYDAGVRLSEAIERDMVQVRLTDSFRFVVVGAPAYLAEHGTPSGLKTSCDTSASRSGRRPRVRFTHGSSSGVEGIGGCPFAGLWSPTMPGSAPCWQSAAWDWPTPSSRWLRNHCVAGS